MSRAPYRYHTSKELRSALEALTAAFPDTSALLSLPHPSSEGNAPISAIQIGTRSEERRRTTLLVGGLHARELVPPEICLSFASDLLRAFAEGATLEYGFASQTAGRVKKLMESLSIIILPCANPDGRDHVQAGDILWRYNRNPRHDPACPGVDLNRNFDFLWDFRSQISPNANPLVTEDPCAQENYHGPREESEPEVRNVVWLLDEFPIGWLVDIHGSASSVLYPWGDDEVQSQHPQLNFSNASLNFVRGNFGDTAYREYMPAADLAAYQGLGQELHSGIISAAEHDVANDEYRFVGSSFGPQFGQLPNLTTGTLQDYAYSRHLTDSRKRKVYSFTLEHRAIRGEPRFAPRYKDQVVPLIREISNGLFSFCYSIAA